MKRNFKQPVLPVAKDETGLRNRILPLVLVVFLFVNLMACDTSGKVVQITTGQYGLGTAEQNKEVDAIFGEDYAEERFEINFHWHNVVHEIGHAIRTFHGGSLRDQAEEEQLVNDFAVAFWTYYGEEDKLNELEILTAYALENVKPPVDEGTTYMEYAREKFNQWNWAKDDFFTFNNYGWFQFNCVSSSLRNRKSLESVLTEMGVKDVQVQPQKTLVYPTLGKDEVPKIIEDVVTILHEWGVVLPDIYVTFSDEPHMHMFETISPATTQRNVESGKSIVAFRSDR